VFLDDAHNPDTDGAQTRNSKAKWCRHVM